MAITFRSQSLAARSTRAAIPVDSPLRTRTPEVLGANGRGLLFGWAGRGESHLRWSRSKLKVVEKFIENTGWRPQRIELIAGALPYSRYNFLVRFIMRRISAKEGGDTDTSHDYEYTDWNAIDRFARELTQRCHTHEATGTPREQFAAPA